MRTMATAAARALLTCAILAAIIGTVLGRRYRLAHRFLTFEGCKDKQSALTWSNYSLSHGEEIGEVKLNFDIIIDRQAKTWKKMVLKLTRCRDSIISADTCEYYQTWRYSLGLCTMVTIAGMPWAGFVRQVQPPLRCPVKAGHYQMRNGSLDIKLFDLAFEFIGEIFDVVAEFYDENNQLHLCVHSTSELVHVRTDQPQLPHN